jgi:hypothetical protein
MGRRYASVTFSQGGGGERGRGYTWPLRTQALIIYRLRPSSSGLTPARARRTASEGGDCARLIPYRIGPESEGALPGLRLARRAIGSPTLLPGAVGGANERLGQRPVSRLCEADREGVRHAGITPFQGQFGTKLEKPPLSRYAVPIAQYLWTYRAGSSGIAVGSVCT